MSHPKARQAGGEDACIGSIWFLWPLAWVWALIRSVRQRQWTPAHRGEFRHSEREDTSRGAGFLAVAVLITTFISLGGATVLEEWWEKEVLVIYLPESWIVIMEGKSKRKVFWPTYILFEARRVFHRNLNLDEKTLTNNALPVRVINALREGTAENKAKAHQEIIGINLKNRDLRYARLIQAALPKADLRGADIQGANLRGATIGGAEFREADLKLADLRKLNRMPLTEEGYQNFQQFLKKWIDDAALRAAILEKFKKAIRQKDTLNKVENPEQCLTDAPELLELWPNCLPEEQLTDYRLALVDYLVKELACRDSSISLGIAYRAQVPGEIDLASALLKANCAPVRESPERIKKQLKEIAERSQASTK